MRRVAVLRVALALASILVSLVAVELALRVYHASRAAASGDLRRQLERSRQTSLEDAAARGHFDLRGLIQASALPGLVFELKPRLDGEFKGGTVRTNSWGFRGAEVEMDKPAGTLRVVGLGDSFMFGWGVHQEESYMARLAAMLDVADGGGYEVLNLAVPGYNTAMEVEAFAAKGIAFDPDLVVIHFFSNDLALPFFMQPPKDFLTRRRGFFLLDLVRGVLGRADRTDDVQRRLLRHDRVHHSGEDAAEVQRAYSHMTGRAGYVEAMARLAVLARERAIAVVVVLLEDHVDTGQLVRQVAEDEGMHVLDVRPRFVSWLREHGKDESQWQETFWVSDRDRHPNALGHWLYADALFDFLSARDLIEVPNSL